MIYEFWSNADFFDEISSVYLIDSNIDTISYRGYSNKQFKLIFESGHKLDDSQLPELTFYYEESQGDIFTELLLNVYGLTIVSKLVKKIFVENQIQGVQYVPITIKSRDRKTVNKNYYIINFLSITDAINLEYSDYIFHEKYDIYSFWSNQICFDEQKIGTVDIFKDLKSLKAVFVSSRVKKIFTDNNWLEMNFTPLECGTN